MWLREWCPFLCWAQWEQVRQHRKHRRKEHGSTPYSRVTGPSHCQGPETQEWPLLSTPSFMDSPQHADAWRWLHHQWHSMTTWGGDSAQFMDSPLLGDTEGLFLLLRRDKTPAMNRKWEPSRHLEISVTSWATVFNVLELDLVCEKSSLRLSLLP